MMVNAGISGLAAWMARTRFCVSCGGAAKEGAAAVTTRPIVAIATNRADHRIPQGSSAGAKHNAGSRDFGRRSCTSNYPTMSGPAVREARIASEVFFFDKPPTVKKGHRLSLR